MKRKSGQKKLFDRLKSGLEEGIRFAKGEMTLKTVEIPEAPPMIDARGLIALRKRSAMSQAVFAGILNVSPRTIQSWEQGRRAPSQASLRLIQLFRENPEVVLLAAGISARRI
ncbi:helix-turn-helix domain-containing protein [Candidatus Sumerlaeota bacterium]|nr:helix-turn-helix domain-containing protein [Candidatus Sumerlaeota bacterium]